MRPFTFHPGPRLIAGEALHEKLPALLPEGPCLFVTDEGVRGLGLTQPFCEALEDSGRLVTVFDRVETGEIKGADGRRPERRLGNANDSDSAVVEQLPETAQRLVNASADLYARVKRLDEGQLGDEPAASPARALMGRLERDLIWNRSA